MTIKLKLFAHPSAASATGIAGVVMSPASGSNIAGTTRYGEFTGGAFEAALENGQAVLKVVASTFGGGALTVNDYPVALVRNTQATTGFVTCSVIDE